MSFRPSVPDPVDHASPTQVSQRDEDAEYYREVLHELIELGADLARAVHRQAATTQPVTAPEHEDASQPAPAQAPASDPTIAFDRIARAIRRTIALARTITEPASPSTAQGAHQRRLSARKRIIRDVEDAIQRRASGAEADALHAEFSERLDDPDLDDDIDGQPVADIIAAICRDLGIAALPGTHPWKRRTPRDVRDLCARAAGPRTPQPRPARPKARPTAPPTSGDPCPVSPARTGTGPPRP
jgi:hypothetical protein